MERGRHLWRSGRRGRCHGQLRAGEYGITAGAPRLLFWRAARDGPHRGRRIAGGRVGGGSCGQDAELAGGGPARDEALVVWTDPQGQSIYQWGSAPADAPAAARLPAPIPFAASTLSIHAPDVVAAGASAWRVQWWAGLGAAAVALGLLAVYLHRESTRDLRRPPGALRSSTRSRTNSKHP